MECYCVAREKPIKHEKTELQTWVVIWWDRLFLVGWVGWFFSWSIGEKLFLVGLVDQPFQRASNQIEMVEKAFA